MNERAETLWQKTRQRDLITLYGFGPAFGFPDGSPFVTKTMILLKMAGLPFETNRDGFLKAPKGKVPYIDDDGVIVSDSTFIRAHIETKYGFDFNRGLTQVEQSYAWAIERMIEERFYWFLIEAIWLHDANFNAGPAKIFDALPAPARPLVKAYVRRVMRRTLHLQGLGRHAPNERLILANSDLDSLEGALGGKPFLFGDEPVGADATTGAFLLRALSKTFVAPVRDAVEARPRLVAYADRITQRFFGEERSPATPN